MTLHTERLDIRGIQELLVFGSMGPVTTEAVECQIGISRIYNFRTQWVSRVGLPIVTLGTGVNRICGLLQEHVVRRMG